MHRLPKVLLAVVFCLFAAVWIGCGSSGDGGPPAASIEADGSSGATDGRPKVTRHPVVVITTSLGAITVELDRLETPLTVDNFLDYVGKNHYDDTIFHQVDRGFMVLAGGYHSNLSPIPAEFPIRNEAQEGRKNLRGTIAMARLGDSVDSATSQFFFNLSDNPALDYQPGGLENYGYCAFGKVTAGLDVLDRIASVAVADSVHPQNGQRNAGASVQQWPNMPREPVIIESIRRVR